jgi:hypothetical protein
VGLAMERVETSSYDLGMEARGVWNPLTIRQDHIEGPHRKYNHLR